MPLTTRDVSTREKNAKTWVYIYVKRTLWGKKLLVVLCISPDASYESEHESESLFHVIANC